MSGELDSRKDSHSKKLEQRPWILAKLNISELCDSKLSVLYPFYNMAIIHWVKNRSKTDRLAVSSWETSLWSNFCDHHWNLTYCNKWDPATSEISTPLGIVERTNFHAQHGTKTTPVSADREDSWPLLPSLVSLLSGS